MKILGTTLSFVVLMGLSACQRYAEIYSVTFRSKSGAVLASGTIKLKTPLPAEGRIKGAYRLKTASQRPEGKEAEWFYRLLRDKEKGEMEWRMQPGQPEDWQYAFDFMPGMADANLVGNSPKLKDGKTIGWWLYSTFSGGGRGGTIELQRE